MRKVRGHAIKAVVDCIGENETPAIVIQFELDDDSGKTIRKTSWLTDAAIEYSIRDLRTCGFTGNDPFVLDGGDCLKLLPNQVMLVLEDEEGRDGKTYEQIKFINKIGSELAAKNTPKGKALLDIRNRFKAESLRAAAEDKTTPKREPDPPGGDEFDDFETD